MTASNQANPADDILLAYITCESEEQGLAIAQALLDDGLIACGNVLPAVTSVYRWQGRVERSREALLLAKTRPALFERLSARVRELHSYELPCVVAVPLAAGLPDYLDWVRRESGQAESL